MVSGHISAKPQHPVCLTYINLLTENLGCGLVSNLKVQPSTSNDSCLNIVYECSQPFIKFGSVLYYFYLHNYFAIQAER